MRHTMFLLVFLAISACSSQPKTAEQTYQEEREEWADYDDDLLCMTSITNEGDKQSAEVELGRRQATCDWQKVSMMLQAEAMKHQRRAAAANAFLQLQQNMQQQQQFNQMTLQNNQQQNRPINCRTTYAGNQANTTCR